MEFSVFRETDLGMWIWVHHGFDFSMGLALMSNRLYMTASFFSASVLCTSEVRT